MLDFSELIFINNFQKLRTNGMAHTNYVTYVELRI